MKLGIVGLGVVGTANQKGFEALGHDIKCHDIKMNTRIQDVLDTEIVFICVPTPLTLHRDPDLSYILNTMHSIKPHIKDGQIIKSQASMMVSKLSTNKKGFKKLIKLLSKN